MATIDDYLNERIATPLSPIRENRVIKVMGEIDNYLEGIARMNGQRCMEITVTFVPQLRDQWHEATLAQILKNAITSVISRKKWDKIECTTILIGEHSDKGMWHYHGIIEGYSNDMIAALNRKLKKTTGRIEIKQITFWDSYVDYIIKSYRPRLNDCIKPEVFSPVEHIYLAKRLKDNPLI